MFNRLHAAKRHGVVFSLGVATLIGVGAATVGITRAGLTSSAPKPVVDASPVASTTPGLCTLLIDQRAHTMDVDRARTLTMIAGVGTQVGAIPAQIARAVDVAVSDPSKYLPSVNDALALLAHDDAIPASALSMGEVAALGRPGAMSCTFDPAAVPAERKGRDGLTPRADAVKAAVLDAFGKLPVSGATAGSAVDAAAPAEGRSLTVSLAPIDPTKRATGWVLANWLVARGSAYRLDRISYDDHSWQANSGWDAVAPVPTASATATDAHGRLARAAAGAAAASGSARDLDQVQIVVAKGN